MAAKKKSKRVTKGILERSATPLRSPAAAVARRRPGTRAGARQAVLGGGPPCYELGFDMQHQEQGNWCWAAVSTSTALFYDASSGWTQCAVACKELGQSSCCADGSTPACNQYGYLDKALARVGHFASIRASAVPFSTVQSEIAAGRPIGVRIAWSSGGAHFVTVRGYLGPQSTVDVEDPWSGPSQVPYATFASSYLGTGTWTHSYFTAP